MCFVFFGSVLSKEQSSVQLFEKDLFFHLRKFLENMTSRFYFLQQPSSNSGEIAGELKAVFFFPGCLEK